MIAAHLAALTFWDDDCALPPIQIGLALFLHLAGLAAVWRYLQQPIWFAVPTLVVFLAVPGFMSFRNRRGFAVQLLAPLFILYLVLMVRVITIWFLRAPLPYQDESTLANVRLLAFQIELAAIAAVAYTALAQIMHLVHSAPRMRVVVGLSIMLGITATVWFAAETIGHRTRGVTGTDPYAYTQMAVDLATRGTPLHEFPLLREIADLGVRWYPIEHMGYRLFAESESVATVWPFGGSLWLATVYRWFGEEGVYIATPLAALASLFAMALLVWEYLRERSMLERAIVASISVALLATSWEQVDRSLVPLVDAQAQLFSILAIAFALIGARSKHFVAFGIFAGFALGAAYFVRHTQVLLAFPIAFAAWHMRRRNGIQFLLSVALASFAVAFPDLLYHQQNFGSWFTPESHELALFSIAGISSSAQVIADRLFAGNEFGYLIPFLLYGMYRAARENRSKFGVLMLWLAALVGFHLFYPALRMRDLLPEFPIVVLFIAYGIVALARDLRRDVIASAICEAIPNHHFGERFASFATLAPHASAGVTMRLWLCAVVIFLALLLFLTRTQATLLRVIQPARVTFGYMTAAQRASFDQIAALTPANAVIGSTLNDGAVDLYAHRATFRPGEWNADELARFVDAMRGAGRRVYLLDDGAETSAARSSLAQRYVLKQVTVLDVPLFGVVDGMAGVLWEISVE